MAWLIATAITIVMTLLDSLRAGLGGGELPVIVAGAVAIAIFAPVFTLFYRRLHPAFEELRLRTRSSRW